MPFKTKIGDITKQKVDAIVNSLGVDGNIYGSICNSIIYKAKSTDLLNYINSLKDNKIGEIFQTEGYKLPCKNILHLVTPFRHQDDEDCNLLKQNIRKVIDKAIELEYTSLAIPFIGIGFNGYTKNEVYNSLTEVCSDIDNLEAKLGHNLINLTIIIYFGKKRYDATKLLRQFDHNEIYDETIMINDNIKKTFKEEAPHIPSYKNNLESDEIYSCIKAMGEVNKKHYFFADYENYKVPYDFVSDYIERFNLNENEIYGHNLDRKRKYQLKHQKTLKKKEAFLIGYLFGFSQTVMNEFLIVCGLSYTPNSDLDDFFRQYFNGELELECETLYDLQAQYDEFCGGILEF